MSENEQTLDEIEAVEKLTKKFSKPANAIAFAKKMAKTLPAAARVIDFGRANIPNESNSWFGIIRLDNHWAEFGPVDLPAEVQIVMEPKDTYEERIAVRTDPTTGAVAPITQAIVDPRLTKKSTGSVAQVWNVCNANQNKSRKEIIDICLGLGLNIATITTQYQVWSKLRKEIAAEAPKVTLPAVEVEADDEEPVPTPDGEPTLVEADDSPDEDDDEEVEA